MSSISEFQHLRIPLVDIKSATNNFGDTNLIGRGGFGKVYKGEIVLSERLTMVAVKRLDSAFGQGVPEFWKEIMFLSRYKHMNLVSLLGFCDEGGESILVYEFLPNKSLDLYICSPNLSWNQRLRICIGVAHGLKYLHDPEEGGPERVLHRDIKSANILLDQNWKPKISDFGLSKLGPANQQFTYLFSNAVGTMGYCDPLYAQTGFLTKESDIYSFGAVLFEVLCARPCVQNYDDVRRFLPVFARKLYEEKKLDSIIGNSIKDDISPECLGRFSAIAYQCLHIDRSERPLVSKILKELEIALEYQEEYEFEKRKKLTRHHHNVVVQQEYDSPHDYWETKLPRDWELIVKNFNISPAIYATKKELFSHLHKGFLFDQGNQFFWINNDGKKCVLISARRSIDLDGEIYSCWVSQREYLRFSRIADFSYGRWREIEFQIKTSMLSLGTMYAANLVFRYYKPNEDLEQLKWVKIRWKTGELTVTSIHLAELTPDNWYKIRMWHLMNHGPDATFDVVLEELSYIKQVESSDLSIQGIEFQPIEMGQPEDVEGLKGLSITNEDDIDDDDNDDDEYWENKLSDDYLRFIKMSDKPLEYTTKKELYLCLCEGFLCDNGQLLLSICKTTGGICSMLPATDILKHDTDYKLLKTLSLSESRFSMVITLQNAAFFTFKCTLRSLMFSPHPYIYACYLVFKFEDKPILPNDTWFLKAECGLDSDFQDTKYVYSSLSTNIPTIEPKNVNGPRDLLKIPTIEGLSMPKLHTESRIVERKDGWMELMLCRQLCHLEDHKLLTVTLRQYKTGIFSGMIIEGIEFRPCM